MKKRLLTLGALASFFVINAQVTTTVSDKAKVYATKNTLLFNGGGLKVVNEGLISNSGNIMIVGDGEAQFLTVNADKTTPKTTGGNIILNMWDTTADALRYGQLYITGLSQSNITGVVDKEYRDNAHGTYQQIAFPFSNKKLSELSTELGANLSSDRWSQSEILVWNNTKAEFDLLQTAQTTRKNTDYYAVGAKTLKAIVASQTKTVKGVPFADKVVETLQDAGSGANFGANGEGVNTYREKYNTYLQDSWDSSKGVWTGNYGKNIYQFGNPFLTNLDLRWIHTQISNIQGIRMEPQGVTTEDSKSTYSTSATYISYTSAGVPTGDLNKTIVKPLQTFVIKLKDNTAATLDFDKLRRFAYIGNQNESTKNNVNTAKFRSARAVPSTVKQLGVIALNDEGKEIGRTYYVVYSDGATGYSEKAKTQVTASSTDIIGTFEENKEGGLDMSTVNSYWLYINEANENDFKGKEIPLRMYSNDIKAVKFEIFEDAKDVAEGQEKLAGGEGFYFNTGKEIVSIKNGKSITIPIAESTEFGLYYGKPATKQKAEERLSSIEKPSDTSIAFDSSINNYKIFFDPTWKTADVQVFDMYGRLILSKKGVDATAEMIITLPDADRATYVVTAVSDQGKTFSQKIIK